MTSWNLGMFEKKYEFDEAPMHEFWNWFRNNQETGIFNIAREMGLRLKDISGMDGESTYFNLGYAPSINKGTIWFHAGQSSGLSNEELREIHCLYRLTELAPPDIRKKWDIIDITFSLDPYYQKKVRKNGSV